MSTKHLDDPMQVLPEISRIAATVRLAIVEQLPKWQEARDRWLAFFESAGRYYTGSGGERHDLEQGRFPIGRFYVGRPSRLLINCETGTLETHPYQLASDAEVISAYLFEPEWFDIELVLSWLNSLQAKVGYGKREDAK